MLKAKVIYLFIVIGSFLFTILYTDYSALLIFIITLLLPVILNTIAIIIRNSVEVDINSSIVPKNRNEEIETEILIKNKSIFPCINGELKICYYNNFSQNKDVQYINFPLDAGKTQKLYFKIRSKYCGKINIVIESVKIYDYLTLFSAKKKINKSREVIIYPEIHKLNCSSLKKSIEALDGEFFSEEKAGDDPSEVFNVREYIEGDKIQRIHWKLSSKIDNIMVKEFSLPVLFDSMILVEFCENKNSITILQGIIETTISLSHTLLINNCSHYICWYNNNNFKKVKVDTEENMLAVLHEFLLIKPYKGENFALKHYLLENSNKQYLKKFYITSNINKESIINIDKEDMEIYYLTEEEKKAPAFINMKAISSNNLKNSLDNLVI